MTLNPDPSDLQIAGRASERARILKWLAGFHSHAPRGPSKHASNRPATYPATTAGRQQRQLVGPRCCTPLASSRLSLSGSSLSSGAITTRRSNFADDDIKGLLKERGLEAWHSHFNKHLNIKNCRQLRMITAIDMRRMATWANMRLDQKTTDEVLAAIRRSPSGSSPSGPSLRLNASSSEEKFQDFLKSCGLEAWHEFFMKYTSLRTPQQLRVITASDLKKMARAAVADGKVKSAWKGGIPHKTIDQVLAAVRRGKLPF